MLTRLLKFIQYWYFRYLVVTELYMVEPWERILMHILFGVPLFVLGYFNYKLLNGMTSFNELSKISDVQDMNPVHSSF